MKSPFHIDGNGEYDYAWNMQLAPETMGQMVAAGRGDFPTAFGAQVEHIFLNLTDPSPQLPEGERSTVAHPHPILSDIKVRQAVSWAIDRSEIVKLAFFGGAVEATEAVSEPNPFYSGVSPYEGAPNIDKAKSLLSQASTSANTGSTFMIAELPTTPRRGSTVNRMVMPVP